MASNSDVAHAWAHGLEKCHNGSNMHHECGKIYSYNTVIGQRVEINHQVIFLLNSEGYSNSTNKHQGYMNTAIPYDAIKFYFKPNYFYNSYWGSRGFDGWHDFDKTKQIRFVMHYLWQQLEDIQSFSESKSLRTENTVDTTPFQNAGRLIEITQSRSLAFVLRMTNEELKQHKIKEPTPFRKMLKALMSDTPIKEIVDIVCGDATYAKYVERTAGPRNAAYTRNLNQKLGFATQSRWNYYYQPYPYGKQPKSLGYGTCVLQGQVNGGISKKEIEKLKKSGEFISAILKIKEANFAENQKLYETKQQNDRVVNAKKCLEVHIGMRGWNGWGASKITSFNYNGTTITFQYCNQERQLSWSEYNEYAGLTKEEQKQWVIDKKNWMLATLLRENEYNANFQARLEEEQRQREIEKEVRRKLLEEKAEYILELKLQGDDGVRRLWRENLLDSGIYGKSMSFYYGGNALLRVKNECTVETSKGIKVNVDECQRLWRAVSLWHKNQKEFISNTEVVHSTMSDWAIQKYHDDIMVAGCHAIAYCEMERVATQLGFIA